MIDSPNSRLCGETYLFPGKTIKGKHGRPIDVRTAHIIGVHVHCDYPFHFIILPQLLSLIHHIISDSSFPLSSFCCSDCIFIYFYILEKVIIKNVKPSKFHYFFEHDNYSQRWLGVNGSFSLSSWRCCELSALWWWGLNPEERHTNICHR